MEVELYDGSILEFPDDTSDVVVNRVAKRETNRLRIAERKSGNPKEYGPVEAEPVNQGQQLAGQVARMGAQGLAALPLMAMDAGVAIRNMFPGQDYDLPSKMWAESLNSLIPEPEGLGKVNEVLGSSLVGGRIPAPTVKSAPPLNAKVPTPKQQVLQQAQDKGYVVPPTTANPSGLNKVLEGIAGKLTTAQQASIKNQKVTDNVAKRTLGLSEDAPLTQDAIKWVRQKAGEAYDVVRKAGRIVSDEKYRSQLVNLTSKYKGAANDFGKLAKNQEVEDIFESLNKDSFDADSAVDMISILRSNADEAFRAGKSQAGKAYKEASRILEGAIERHLQGAGKSAKPLLDQFRKARELMAKAYSVEKAFNSSTGSMSATKIGQQLAKGKPLSGELKQTGQFAQAFPKAAREINESMPGVSPLDFYATGGAAAITKEPLYLLYPFLRQGVRNALLSKVGQRVLTGPKGDPNMALRMSGANAMEQLREQLLQEGF